MTIRRLTQTLFGLLAGLAVVSATLIIVAAIRRRHLVELQHRQFVSYTLADELRHTSDDLTRFARTYVVTGDPAFERRYRDVLAIRNGTRARPEHYERTYWDLEIDRGTPGPVGPSVSILQRMQEAGFTADELNQLRQALGRSDSLVAIEEIAIHLVRGEYRDASGAFTAHGPRDQVRAVRMMFDSTYHRQKARIMAPIDAFLGAVEARTRAELDEFVRQTQVAFALIETVFGAFVLLVLISYPIMRARVLAPVQALQQQTRGVAADIERLAGVSSEIARGDLSHSFTAASASIGSTRTDEIGDLSRLHDSMLGQLQETGGAIATVTAEMRKAMEEVDIARKNLQAILDTSPVAVAMSVEGVLRYCNPRFVELYGEGMGVTIGSHYVDPADRAQIVADVRETGIVRDRVVKYRTRDDRVIDAMSTFYGVTYQEEPAILAWIVDITHLKQVEEELKRSITQLRELEQLRDDLVHMIVHDMRSPLTALLAELQLLEMDATGETAEGVKGAIAGVRQVNDLASTLLDVSRLEQGKMPLTRAPTDLVQVAASARASLAAIETDRVIAVTSTGPVMANCDAGLVRRVIENLVSNGIKHTPQGGKIVIAVTASSGGARVAVQDEGPGVPPDARERIFEKFGGVAVRKDKTYHSVGLGLAFCKLAVEAHGGTIAVTDAVPRGSIFAFELPA